ncbi:hypothetical protein [Nocardia brevicatena]|uniref:hypothetical protein n=1 Tax=Nocardia brevicatena TaxID=37327 RepID=UPI0002EB6440|nr:hypothetical protein [Nocardia brevicatena]
MTSSENIPPEPGIADSPDVLPPEDLDVDMPEDGGTRAAEDADLDPDTGPSPNRRTEPRDLPLPGREQDHNGTVGARPETPAAPPRKAARRTTRHT